jgi:hypothetical protein
MWSMTDFRTLTQWKPSFGYKMGTCGLERSFTVETTCVANLPVFLVDKSEGLEVLG